MATSQCEARVRHQSGVAIVDLAGQIDGSAEATLSGAYGEVEDEPAVLLNFEPSTTSTRRVSP